jgi:hypothetical protein
MPNFIQEYYDGFSRLLCHSLSVKLLSVSSRKPVNLTIRLSLLHRLVGGRICKMLKPHFGEEMGFVIFGVVDLKGRTRPESHRPPDSMRVYFCRSHSNITQISFIKRNYNEKEKSNYRIK